MDHLTLFLSIACNVWTTLLYSVKINVMLKGERKFVVSAFTSLYDFGGGKKKAFDEYMQKFADTADLLVKRKYGM